MKRFLFCFLIVINFSFGDSYEEEWTNSLALQAATYAAPIVTMYTLRYHIALSPKRKAMPNALWRMTDISTPKLSKEARYVTPNVNVIYGFGFLDLTNTPVMIDVPDSENRYYMIEIVDMWTNAFAYIGGKKTGYKGGKFLLTGPNWKGEVPKAVKQISCPTPWVLVQPRVHIYTKGRVDLSGAKKVLKEIGVFPLSNEKKAYYYIAPELVDPYLPVSFMQYKDPMQFWEIFVAAMNENPPPEEEIKGLLPLFKPLGIIWGKPFDRKQLSKTTITALEKAAQNIGSILAHLPIGTYFEGASLPPTAIGNFKTDYKTRAIIARIGLTANQPTEAIYWIYNKDKQGDGLTGEKKYIMNFKEAPPFEEPGFWSITLYDARNNYTVENRLNRYMLGSDTKFLQKNGDGSFTLYLQKESPGEDKESNWLPTPSHEFYLIIRAYPPQERLIKLLSDATIWPIPYLEKK